MTHTGPQTCPYCGGLHSAVCPRVKAVEYFENGMVKRVEFRGDDDPPPVPATLPPGPGCWPYPGPSPSCALTVAPDPGVTVWYGGAAK